MEDQMVIVAIPIVAAIAVAVRCRKRRSSSDGWTGRVKGGYWLLLLYCSILCVLRDDIRDLLVAYETGGLRIECAE
jgi:hypothetical protein